MWVQISAAVAIVAMSLANKRAVALILSVLSRSSGEPMSCPTCGGATRFHKPYLMCDECKRLVGVRINDKAYPSR
jgi:hypothetical protein